MSGKKVTQTVWANPPAIAQAAEILEHGGLVAVPTETVYGLAARADEAEAVAGIYAAKGRPDFNPLIVHVRDAQDAKRYAQWSDAADQIVRYTWPGPLTLVLPLREDAPLAKAVTAGLGTVALRCPAHPVMQQLLAQTDFPLAAPSANVSGYISPTTVEHVNATLNGRIDMALDGGPSSSGVESTILALRSDGQWQELRPGPVDVEALHRHIYGVDLPIGARESDAAGKIEAPGQLASHYAPDKPVRLRAEEVAPDEFCIGFHEFAGDCNLSPNGDLTIAAARLYECLHHADASAKPRIAVAPIPDKGIGKAINDRLRRAAA